MAETLARLQTVWNLEPDTAARANFLLYWLDRLGIPYTVTSGRRSTATQAAEYQRHPATAAAPGHSLHETGRAFDLGGPNSPSFPFDAWPYVEYIAAYAGLGWGGRFSTPDYGHFFNRGGS